jgi:hypothetical protein
VWVYYGNPDNTESWGIDIPSVALPDTDYIDEYKKAWGIFPQALKVWTKSRFFFFLFLECADQVYPKANDHLGWIAL